MSCQLIRRGLLPLSRNYFFVPRMFAPNVLGKRNFFRRPDPFSEIQRSFDSFFRDLERSFFPSFYQMRSPIGRTVPMETVENGQRMFKIEIDLPDFKPENVNVTVKKGQVTIEAKYEITEGMNKQCKRINYTYSLPEDANLDKVRSLLTTDGRLLIEVPLPQPEQSKENREIPIKRE